MTAKFISVIITLQKSHIKNANGISTQCHDANMKPCRKAQLDQ